MQQSPFESELHNLERRFERRLAEDMESALTRIEILEQPQLVTENFSAPPNYLPNSHPEWSKLAYGTAATTPTTAGDTNRECYNWYRQDAADKLLAETGANALKRSFSGTEHTLWAANEGTDNDIPRWDGVNGTFLLGSSSTNWDIACKLPTDFVFPGQKFYVYFEAGTASTSIAIPSSLQLYCGFWDNTSEAWVTGGSFTPTASVQGIAGARTLEYKIHAKTDTGDEILSTAIAVTTAPSSMSTDNHVRLSFTGAPGFIYYGIYRKDGSNYYRVAEIRNSIDLQFFDMVESGSTVVPVAAYPVVTVTAPRAYAITGTFDPSSLSSTAFLPHTMTIQVPLTYDRGATDPETQWFRFGLDELMTAASERGIVIRRLSVSEGYGGWARSALDLGAASSPTSTASGAPAGGNPTGDPPGGGSGGSTCVLLDTKISTTAGEVVIESIKARECFVDNHVFTLPVLGTLLGDVAEIAMIKTSNGLQIGCSLAHRFIRSSRDRIGIAASKLKEGDELLTCIDGKYESSAITSYVIRRGVFQVKTLKLPAPHLFIANGFVCHNSKDPNTLP